MEAHPLAELFPPMSAEEFEGLKNSIRTRGYDKSEPVVTYEGQILDGRHRFRACLDLGLEAPTAAFSEPDPLLFVISKNLSRRHLDESQRAMIGARASNLGHGQKKADSGIPLSATTQAEAARNFKVSADSVKAARVVIDKAAPDRRDSVRAWHTRSSATGALSSTQHGLRLGPRLSAIHYRNSVWLRSRPWC